MSVDHAINSLVLYRKSFEALLHAKQQGLIESVLKMDSNISENARQEANPQPVKQLSWPEDRQLLIQLLAPLAAQMPFEYGDIPQEWHLPEGWQETLEAAVKWAAEQAKKRTRPPIPDIFTNGYATVPTPLTIQAIINAQQNAASGGDRWQHPEGHPPFYVHKTKAGATIVEYIQNRNETLNDVTTASLWAQVRESSDLDSDVLLGMFAHMIKCPAESDGSVWFFADNMLDYRGVQPRMKADTPGGKKRRAGHRPEDRLEIGHCVDRATNIWLTIDQYIYEEQPKSKRKQGKRRQYTHQGRLLSVDEIWYQRELDIDTNAPNIPIGWRIRPGDWLRTFLESPDRYVAWLCQRTLQYDPYREQWEKRLSKYFMFHMRMNAAGGGKFNRKIGPLLSELSLPINRRDPERTKQRFEKAMNRLVSDRQIDDWAYAEKIDYKARGWVETWLTNKITVYIAPPAKQVQEASK